MANDQLRTELARFHVPAHLHDGLIHYVVNHFPPGSFLQAVLANDLREACQRADRECQAHLWDIVNFLHNACPSGCWGSPAVVRAWLETRPRVGMAPW